MYIACILTILASAAIFLPKDIKNGKTIFAIICALVLFIYAALRSPAYSGDVEGYIRKFNQYKGNSLIQMFQLYKTDIKSPTFHLLGWIWGRVFKNPQVWLAFIGGVYATSVMWTFYKESKDSLMSIIMFLALGFFAFSLSGLRQTMALSFTALAYFPAKNRKLLKFLVFVFIALLFHESAVVFLLIYPIANKKLGLGHILVATITVVLFLFFQGSIRGLIARMFEDSYLGGYAGQYTTLTLVGFLIQLVIFVFALIYYPKVVKKNPDMLILYNLAFLGLLFQLYASMIAEMFRVSMYFSFFNVLLLPEALSVENDKKMKDITKVILFVLFFIYMFRGGIPSYQFFW